MFIQTTYTENRVIEKCCEKGQKDTPKTLDASGAISGALQNRFSTVSISPESYPFLSVREPHQSVQ